MIAGGLTFMLTETLTVERRQQYVEANDSVCACVCDYALPLPDSTDLSK